MTQRRGPSLFIIIAIVAFFLLRGFLSGPPADEPIGDGIGQDDGGIVIQEENAAEEPAPANAPAESDSADTSQPEIITGDIFSQEIMVEDVRWAFLDAFNQGATIEGGGSLDDLKAEGTFVLVTIEVTNTGEEDLTFIGLDLYDSSETKYVFSADALSYVVEEEACNVVPLAPEASQICTYVYDVPAAVVGELMAMVSNLSLTGDQVKYVALGLE
ncbi:MAG: hypothetical protein AAF639_23890 [Chloroflexota bacterium]